MRQHIYLSILSISISFISIGNRADAFVFFIRVLSVFVYLSSYMFTVFRINVCFFIIIICECEFRNNFCFFFVDLYYIT